MYLLVQEHVHLFHCFNRYTYLKLGVSASCQILMDGGISISITTFKAKRLKQHDSLCIIANICIYKNKIINNQTLSFPTWPSYTHKLTNAFTSISEFKMTRYRGHSSLRHLSTLYNKRNYCIHVHMYLFVREHVHFSIALTVVHI